MIIIEVSIYADGHVFPHIVKKYVIVIINIIFHLLSAIYPYPRGQL